ncbi:hypothetical protein BU197_05905 [Streptomyces sp. CBMA291]|nr:hypothetical protein [Streptomyces sp. CBMA291]MBD0715953.1 hypothetical protein [Streptomyces sp. CBMA370]
MRRTGARLAGALAGALLILAGTAAAPAQAAGYRYWSFWESAGGKPWTYATQGAATARPGDGDLVGFRFAVSSGTSDATKPTTAPGFTTICGDATPKSGEKRVGVVVDFGGAQDAPPGENPPQPPVRVGCAVIREDASAAEALAILVKPLRYDSSAMLCGIAGYPARGCGEQVAEQTASPAPDTTATAPPAATDGTDGTDTGGGPSFGVLAGGAAVLALGGAAVWKGRRRG